MSAAVLDYKTPDELDHRLRRVILTADKEKQPFVAAIMQSIHLPFLVDATISEENEGGLPSLFADETPVDRVYRNVQSCAQSCGAQANQLCDIFVDTSLGNCARIGKDFEAKAILKQLAEFKDQPAIIRFEVMRTDQLAGSAPIGAHVYVAYFTGQFKDADPLGFIYQSNIATQLVARDTFSLLEWLQSEKAVKINLSEHFTKMDKLMKSTDLAEKTLLYQELYLCKSPTQPLHAEEKITDMDALVTPAYSYKYQVEKVNVASAITRLDSLVTEARKEEEKAKLIIGDDDLVTKLIKKQLGLIPTPTPTKS